MSDEEGVAVQGWGRREGSGQPAKATKGGHAAGCSQAKGLGGQLPVWLLSSVWALAYTPWTSTLHSSLEEGAQTVNAVSSPPPGPTAELVGILLLPRQALVAGAICVSSPQDRTHRANRRRPLSGTVQC